jgi:hypothetical protein
MANTSVITNQWIPNQFPNFYKTDGPLFISFIKAYYEFLEQPNNVLYHTRNLTNYKDIDNTPDAFLQYFKDQYLENLPNTMVTNKRLLIKHVLDLYRSKGSQRGYELLFRILFNEDISLYYPGQNLFKPDDNTWIVPKYIEVSDSPFLSQLEGLSIFSPSNGATALVESYNRININNQIINVLNLSDISGVFTFGSTILSEDLPVLTASQAPIVTGSLSAVSVEEGGAFYNLGDEVQLNGLGSSAIGIVSGIRSENGKVIFDLLNGGKGYTLNPQIQITGGGGSGATFSIGSIVNKEVFLINTDIINSFYNTQLDNATEGFNLHITGLTGSFSGGEVVNSTANGIALDFAYLSGNSLSNTETLSNSSLGISGLEIIYIDNPNYVNLTGPEASLNNANLRSGVILLGGTSGDTIYVNSVLPKQVYLANGTIFAANSTVLTVNNASGYFLPTAPISGVTSHATATISQTIRTTQWPFLAANGNLDSSIQSLLTNQTLVVGTIASLINENPGDGYSANPVISIIEPLIAQLDISDGQGGFLGQDANVSGTASNANGIITAITPIDSGYGFSPGEPLVISSNNPIVATGSAIVDGTGISKGYWTNNKSFPDDQVYLQDDYYYQIFSYEITAPRMMSTYQQFVTDIVHPIGMVMFGRYGLKDYQSANTSVVSFSQK